MIRRIRSFIAAMRSGLSRKTRVSTLLKICESCPSGALITKPGGSWCRDCGCAIGHHDTELHYKAALGHSLICPHGHWPQSGDEIQAQSVRVIDEQTNGHVPAQPSKAAHRHFVYVDGRSHPVDSKEQAIEVALGQIPADVVETHFEEVR